jgi:hypothetical protein
LKLIAKEGDLKITTIKSPTITNTNKLVLGGSSKKLYLKSYMDAHCKVSPLSQGRPRAMNSNASTQPKFHSKSDCDDN